MLMEKKLFESELYLNNCILKGEILVLSPLALEMARTTPLV